MKALRLIYKVNFPIYSALPNFFSDLLYNDLLHKTFDEICEYKFSVKIAWSLCLCT